MLKRYFYGALAALFLLCALCIGSSVHLGHVTDELFSKARECSLQQDRTSAGSPEALIVLWREKLAFLESTLPHAEVEAVGQALAEFAGAADAKDEAEFRRAYGVLCEKLAHLKNADSFSLRNIL